MIICKSPDELALMREAGRITAEILDEVSEAVRPGVTTQELDALARRLIEEAGCEPAFLGYRGFPATLCISPNETVNRAWRQDVGYAPRRA